MARPMGARRAPSRRSSCGDKFALDWQHPTQSGGKSPNNPLAIGDKFAIMSASSPRPIADSIFGSLLVAAIDTALVIRALEAIWS